MTDREDPMALKITLKPHERMIIGGAVITNGSTRSDFIVENTVPILRQKDILSEKDANSPCRLIYFVIQLMYVDEKNLKEYHNTYWRLVRDVLDAAPSTLGLIDQISEHILDARYYQALKTARKLIDHEQEVMKHVRSTVTGIQKDS
jgi:flagellar protein FlbT